MPVGSVVGRQLDNTLTRTCMGFLFVLIHSDYRSLYSLMCWVYSCSFLMDAEII
jgi:hypothetical protein